MDEIHDLIEKAAESLRIARIIHNEQSFGFATSRAYYAMLYATQALLLIKKLSFSKHSAIIAIFGKEYVKSGLVDAKFHQYLLEAFDLRQLGDYEPKEQITEETSARVLANANEFIEAAKLFIKD